MSFKSPSKELMTTTKVRSKLFKKTSETARRDHLQDQTRSREQEQGLRHLVKGYREQLNTVRDSNDRLLDKLRKLEEQIEDLQGQIVEGDAKKKRMSRRVERLEAQVSALELVSTRKEPLVENGAAIRLRLLEQVREKMSKLLQEEVDTSIIEGGNIAAHHGNGKADEALFKNDLIFADSVDTLQAIFKKLYHLIMHCTTGTSR